MRELVMVFVMGMAATAVAGEHGDDQPAQAPATKAPRKHERQTEYIKDPEALRYVQQRLETQTGVRGWKIDLKETVGTSKEFIATAGDRSEKGSINVVKDYPNQGVNRVYVVPKD